MLKPLADRVLVEVDVEESKTAGGIFASLIQRRRNPRKGQLLPSAAGRSLTTENVYRLKWR